MQIRKYAVTSALVIATVGAGTGLAQAAPPAASPATASAPAATHTADGVGWSVTRTGQHVTVRTESGSLAVESGRLVVRDDRGTIVEAVPLALEHAGNLYPVAAHVDGRQATLAASRTPSPLSARLHQVDLPAAVGGVRDAIGLTASVGGFLGAATGLVGGCLLGATAAGVVSAPAALLFGAGPLAGCVGGALLVGTTASLAGTAVGGIGSALANAPQFIRLLNAPPAKKG
ncbi:hypothetical protein G4X40_21540 [Rhodococcus sp. D2-41]|uniref:DUF8020 domain-containing protein n=1 Tax=Speluncibacter jeojiensis TaxID=2710754 RepID=A0A9X4M224_9ACTN|nr:hypothetical protein [Rhodococcus sp. D2-41]MDG3012726.1 hypothetical protein [Rhodococcus sp. D2-41]MDG3015404.1 hypothetical protein [Corynebacteriales bacterium D3-21]